jgi:hypothetical protein
MLNSEPIIALEFSVQILPETDRIRLKSIQGARKSELKGIVRKNLAAQGVVKEAYFSASHTFFENESAVIVVGSNQRVGVDIENRHRSVHPLLGEKISKETERGLGLSVLELWVIKEAAFKANPHNHGTVISRYCVIEWNKTKSEGWVRHIDKTFSVKIVLTGNWIVGLSFAGKVSIPQPLKTPNASKLS